MDVCCECCVLSGRGLFDELITRPEESYRLWCIVVCDLETSRMRRPWPALGRSATDKYIYISNMLVLLHIWRWRIVIYTSVCVRVCVYTHTHTHTYIYISVSVMVMVIDVRNVTYWHKHQYLNANRIKSNYINCTNGDNFLSPLPTWEKSPAKQNSCMFSSG